MYYAWKLFRDNEVTISGVGSMTSMDLNVYAQSGVNLSPGLLGILEVHADKTGVSYHSHPGPNSNSWAIAVVKIC